MGQENGPEVGFRRMGRAEFLNAQRRLLKGSGGPSHELLKLIAFQWLVERGCKIATFEYGFDVFGCDGFCMPWDEYLQDCPDGYDWGKYMYIDAKTSETDVVNLMKKWKSKRFHKKFNAIPGNVHFVITFDEGIETYSEPIRKYYVKDPWGHMVVRDGKVEVVKKAVHVDANPPMKRQIHELHERMARQCTNIAYDRLEIPDWWKKPIDWRKNGM